MVDYNEYVYELLTSTGEEVIYERFREKVSSPCISYIEISNISYALTDAQEVSDVIYQVKIWGETAEEIATISNEVDEVMREGGFRRTLCQTLNEPTTLQLYKVLQYEAYGLEQF